MEVYVLTRDFDRCAELVDIFTSLELAQSAAQADYIEREGDYRPNEELTWLSVTDAYRTAYGGVYTYGVELRTIKG